MSEEEKKAIEDLKEEIKGAEYEGHGKDRIVIELKTILNLIENQQEEIEDLKEKYSKKLIDNYRYFPKRLKEEIYKLEDFVSTFKIINNTECYAYKVAKEKLELLEQIYFKY